MHFTCLKYSVLWFLVCCIIHFKIVKYLYIKVAIFTLFKYKIQWHKIHLHVVQTSPLSIFEIFFNPSIRNSTPDTMAQSPASQPLVTSTLHCVSEFTILGNSCEWDHTGFVLPWLASVTEHNVFKVYPCCSVCQNILFKTEQYFIVCI